MSLIIIPEPAIKKYVSTPNKMFINKMSNGIPVRVFRIPIITVRDPIRQLMGLIIMILPKIELFFGLLVISSIGNVMKFYFFLIISILISFKKIRKKNRKRLDFRFLLFVKFL